jgi:hypothetical protein
MCWGKAQVVEFFPSKHETLSSNPSNIKKGKKKKFSSLNYIYQSKNQIIKAVSRNSICGNMSLKEVRV